MHSRTSILRTLSAGFVALGMAGIASAQSDLGDSTQDTAACCQLTTSLIQDVLRGKDVAGDERFFSAEGAPPNIHFLIDTSGSMRELPQIQNSNHIEFFDNTTNGCVNARLDAFQLSRGWNPTTVYPVPDMGTGLGSDTGFPNLFQDNRFYGYMYWGDSSNPTPQWATRDAACQSQVPNWNTSRAADYARCQVCLDTKGYYKLPEAEAVNSGDLSNPDFILKGRFLNFNPPKYVTAKAVLKQVVKDLRRVRAGFSVFTNDSTSTQLRQRQNPTCDAILSNASAFDGNRESYINDINSLGFSTGTPLARSLLNVGFYFTSDDGVYRDVFGFGSGYAYPATFRNGALDSPGRSVCWGCQASSVIIVTDGEPTSDTLSPTVVNKLRQLNDGPVYCPDSAWCGTNSGSGRDRGNNLASYTDDNGNYYLDDVAKLLANQDLQRDSGSVASDFNTAGRQSVSVYTVGFGINSNLLKHTAEVGNGLYYTAEDSASLKQALLEIISNVQTRATSFSSAAASSLQVRAAGAAVIPRFEPGRNRAASWKGYLYRFKLGPERLLNCVPSGTGDLNNDGDCNDTHLIDAAGDAIIENDEGDFVKLAAPTVPAVPFWEAGAKLRPPTGNTQRWMTRRIYTVVDRNSDNKLDRQDAPIEFNENPANVALLRDYLGISDNATACNDLATRLGVPSLSPDDCAKVVIRWYRGADVFNVDPSLRNYDRPFLLHDIFHSSPVSVEPPMPRILCDFSSQCTYTLFSGSTPGTDSYEPYQQAAGDRDKVVLVGSNGGMLHAFHNGHATGAVDPLTRIREYDEGTGEELWAFIPPDMLPRLRPNLGKHAYFVDATPMVREVWLDGVDGAADGTKQEGEFRTVAVVGTGRGGVHRFALDLTRLLGRNMHLAGNIVVPDQAGDFLWMWPQPCDPLALQVGESFSNFSPRPPPIGPVALSPEADDGVRALYGMSGPSSAPWLVESLPARERWVVALNGGYDQSHSRGRGMAIVDLTTGHTLWSFFHGDGQTRSEHLRYPIGAGLSLLDIGRGTDVTRDADLLLDSATVGDYGGQLWMLRMWKPGTWDSSAKRINNWFAARAFRVEKPSTSTHDEAVRGPFSYMTTNTFQPDTGYLRTFVGTGDKENLLDKGSTCRLSNPHACAAQGCRVNTSVKVERGGSEAWSSSANFQDFHYATGAATANAAGASCGGARATLSWDVEPANGCTADNQGSIQYTCDGDSSSWSCRETANTWTVLNFNDADRPYPRRFYGVWTYGVAPDRTFNTDAEATAYDNVHFTDGQLVNVGQFDSSGRVIDNAQQEAPSTGKGWYIEYANGSEGTGNNGALVSGCMVWGSFEPSGSSGAVCSTTGTNKARVYQANYATGRANCAEGFFTQSTNSWARYVEFNSVASAPEPTMQLSVGGGQLSRGITILGPSTTPTGGPGPGPGPGGSGGVPSLAITTTEEGVKSLYQITLDAEGHACRHEGSNCE
ncbi:pilus assembly protein PilY [Hyalangium rubrum]|uniref:Pilus assembly protein PilY n=1 Tax=Hyalangium rubrum TaxID=3103134 RepID=A0ABU5HEZ1_9BACT|nr:pilus assembly protein PilY [Hyalangium sp. s54d21]MDY7231372.1 pilus assembly protein PilY [Hyalangium sp. s54d21]